MKYFVLFILITGTGISYCSLGYSQNVDVHRGLSSQRKNIRRSNDIQTVGLSSYSWKKHRFASLVRYFSVLQKNASHSHLPSPQNIFSSFLFHGAQMGRKFHLKPLTGSREDGPSRWVSCGQSPQILDIHSISVKPDPLTIPGTLTFSFDIVFHDTISSSDNVTLSLKIYAKARGVWVEMPCIGPVGSCTYKNFCQVLEPKTCPSHFIDHGIPCKCPFKKGEYKLSAFPIEIDAQFLFPDDYKGRIVITSLEKGTIACYQVYFTVADLQ